MSIASAKKPLKGRPPTDSEAVNVRLERERITALDEWRRTQLDLPTRPEAIRRLIELGLSARNMVTVDDLIAHFKAKQDPSCAEMVHMARLEITDPKEAERLHTVRKYGPPPF
jgi:hypothetical protein